MTATTDRIEKQILLHHSRVRVWQAISDSTHFSKWIGLCDHGEFLPGEIFTAKMAPTRFNADFAALQAPYSGLPVRMTIERMEPMSVFAFRFHPFAIDRNFDYSREPMNLVTFTLEQTEQAPAGILLTITESGFDRIPAERRATAYPVNERGWSLAIKAIEAYLL